MEHRDIRWVMRAVLDVFDGAVAPEAVHDFIARHLLAL